MKNYNKTNNKFEFSVLKWPSGYEAKLPVYTESGEETPETRVLLGIANTIYSFMDQNRKDLVAITQEIAELYKPSDKPKGLIIEDETNANSVNINCNTTVLNEWGVGKSQIPTEMVVEMLNVWQHHIHNSEQQAGNER